MPAWYEREYTTKLDWRVQLRVGFSTRRGRVVARFDHDHDAEMGHDVTEEGLHLDVYRDGEKHEVKDDYPPVNLNDAIEYCETELRDKADRYAARFGRWHDVNPKRR